MVSYCLSVPLSNFKVMFMFTTIQLSAHTYYVTPVINVTYRLEFGKWARCSPTDYGEVFCSGNIVMLPQRHWPPYYCRLVRGGAGPGRTNYSSVVARHLAVRAECYSRILFIRERSRLPFPHGLKSMKRTPTHDANQSPTSFSPRPKTYPRKKTDVGLSKEKKNNSFESSKLVCVTGNCINNNR